MSDGMFEAPGTAASPVSLADSPAASYLRANDALARAPGDYLAGRAGGSDGDVYAQNDARNRTAPVDRWNPQSGADYLNDPNNTYRGRNFIGSTSNGFCAPAVREALHAGGVDTRGHPVDAKDYGEFLQGRGFAPISH